MINVGLSIDWLIDWLFELIDIGQLDAEVAAVDGALVEVEDVLDQMELCARDTEQGSALRTKFDNRIASYRCVLLIN